MGTLAVDDVSPPHSNTLGKADRHLHPRILPQPQPRIHTPAEEVVEHTLEFREHTAVSGTLAYVDTNSVKASARVTNDVNVIEGVRGADTVAAVEVVVVEADSTLLHQAADTRRRFEHPVTGGLHH